MIERLAKDLQTAFPGVGGFFPSNVWRMRGFYLAYTAELTKLAQPVRELDGASLPTAVAEIPWGHNILLVEKLDDQGSRRAPSLRLAVTTSCWSRSSMTRPHGSGTRG